MITMLSKTENQATFVKINNLNDSIGKAINQALFEIGAENVRHCKSLMTGKKTGRIYNISGKLHQASAPGEAPAIITENLFRSVDYEVRGSKQMEFGDKSTDKAPYGMFLEKGTSKMKPRPHIQRTVIDKEKDAFVSFVTYTEREIGL